MTKIVLDWRKRDEWIAELPKYAAHLLTPAIKRKLATKRPKCWSDDMSWIPGREHLVPKFLECFTSHYTHLKAFHGCRPVTLSSYYKHGLMGQDRDKLLAHFREIYSDLPSADLDAAIAKFSDRSARERGSVWLVGDDRELVEEYGHYIIQGSEFLMALAAALGSSSTGEDFRFRLRDSGIPTVLEVDIPIEIIGGNDIQEVAQMVLSEWGQTVTELPLGFSSSPCYVVRRDIPPQFIEAHTHPARIPDPHRGFISYINDRQTCEFCRSEKPVN
ncbi:hypothetical protein [Burkholderia ubonensis]|uniref:hypothetical protein n=1 Tax=Burkholderia ubonensis TaxID=101571 RepID=UPI000B061626|nr:hypothetical protein [Burkholderia ubonensis]